MLNYAEPFHKSESDQGFHNVKGCFKYKTMQAIQYVYSSAVKKMILMMTQEWIRKSFSRMVSCQKKMFNILCYWFAIKTEINSNSRQ